MTKNIKKELIYSLYSFELERAKYQLCPSNIGFFQPFKKISDVQQQVKTTLISPIIGLCSIIPNIIEIIKNIVITGIGMSIFDRNLFIIGLTSTVYALERMIIVPLVASIVTLASLLSIVTRTIAAVGSFNGGEFTNNLFPFLPDNPFKKYTNDWTKDIIKKLISSLYRFELERTEYQLCPSNIGFFQPFEKISDVQQQVKTTLISPIIGLCSIIPNIIEIIKNIVITGIGMSIFDRNLFIIGLTSTVYALERMIIVPLVASIVTLASLLSIVTRTIAAVGSFNGGEFTNNLFPFLPDNPFKN